MSAPILLHARCALLDIEGTVADVRFVYDVMFPFVREQLRPYLERQWESPALWKTLGLLALDAGLPLDETPWSIPRDRSPSTAAKSHAIDQLCHHVLGLMDADSKATGLKALQGLIWESGFHSGKLRAEIFPDVLPALERWKASGIDLKIYSSGSVLAQKLFFGHTTQGDLTPWFNAYFDTHTGSKREAASYRRIAEQSRLQPNDMVFFTDVLGEIEAATNAGMQVVACIRPHNTPLPDSYSGLTTSDWNQVALQLPSQ
jgi:enolase-phosphatase E1